MEELFIGVQNDNNKQEYINFKNFLERQDIDEVEKIEIPTKSAGEGTMGWIEDSGVILLLPFAIKPLMEVIKAVSKYLGLNKEATVEITVKGGYSIKVSSKNKEDLDPEKIAQLLINTIKGIEKSK